MAFVWILLAEANTNVGRLEDATAAIDEALVLIRDQDAPRHLAVVQSARGRVATIQGRLDDAIVDQQAACQGAVQAGNTFLRQLSTLLLGEAHVQAGQPEHAIDLLAQLRAELDSASADANQLAIAAEVELAGAYLEIGDLDRAAKSLMAALSIFDGQSPCALGSLRLNEAGLHRLRGELLTARALGGQALSLLHETGLAWGYAHGQLELARIETADRNTGAANQRYDQAAALFASFPNPRMVALIESERAAFD